MGLLLVSGKIDELITVAYDELPLLLKQNLKLCHIPQDAN